jgi:multidrug efflux pump subunit AcrB
MWIVQLALRRPVTVAVMSALMLLLGIVSLGRMNFDIFPAIDMPLVNMVWNYPGLSAEEMEQRVVNISERAASTTVNGVDHIESISYNGIGLLKFYFQSGSDTGLAIAQLAAVCEAIKNILPPGISPPSVIDYNATNVPCFRATPCRSDSFTTSGSTSPACSCSPFPASPPRPLSAELHAR